jgi:hypothetical protein
MIQLFSHLFEYSYLCQKEAYSILPKLIASNYIKSRHLPANTFCTRIPSNSMGPQNTCQTNINNFFNR